jgi:hypothetical protein
VILLALVAGCAKLPFPLEATPALANPDPAAMCDQFARALPERFVSDDTIVIQAPFHEDMAILDVLRVDRSAGTLRMVALNQLGVTLFDVRADRSSVTVGNVLPPLANLKNILDSVAQDFANIYLDATPSNSAKTVVGSTTVQFSERGPDGTLIYEFGGDPTVLFRKQLDGWFWTKWSVRYFKYSSEFGGLYPRGIVVDNGRFHYRIIVKNRDVEIDR